MIELQDFLLIAIDSLLTCLVEGINYLSTPTAPWLLDPTPERDREEAERKVEQEEETEKKSDKQETLQTKAKSN